jgi:hypothetical protein
MENFLLWVVQKISAYGFNKGLDKIFKNQEDFNIRLAKVIDQTICEYEGKYSLDDSQGKFSFYKSEIIIEEFLKFRLFGKEGYSIDENSIQNALERNPNIIKPNTHELETFFSIFDSKVMSDDKLKELEIEKFHKEKIYEIYNKIESILTFLKSNLVEVVGLLEEEYRAEIDDCLIDIKALKPQTALKKIQSIENRINANSKHISDKLKANLSFLKAICFEGTGNTIESQENFIKAFKLCPENFGYLERACINYYILKNIKYQELKLLIEQQDDFNPICWAINVLEENDVLTFLREKVPTIAKEKHRFKRLVFNNLLNKSCVDEINLLDTLEFDRIPKALPEFIDYDNIHHWVFILNGVSIKYLKDRGIPFYGQLKKEETSIYFLQLLRMLTNYITNCELDKGYNGIVFMCFWLESEIDINPNTITKLTNAYDNLAVKDAFKTLLFSNSLQKHVGDKEAIDIINNFGCDSDEYLISLKTFCNLKYSKFDDSYQQYFRIVKKIDSHNIQNVCSYLLPICSLRKDSKENILNEFEHITFLIPIHEKLIKLLIESLFEDNSKIELTEINLLKEKTSDEYSLFFFVAYIYYANQYFAECAAFIKSYVSEDEESRDLLLYIRALNSHKSFDQLELLRLLKIWRENFSFNDYLLRIELEIRQILKDRNEILIICKYALSQLPQDEIFYTLYLITLSYLNQKLEIEKQLIKVIGFTFNNTENAIRIANILIEMGYKGEGIEILYQKAKNKLNSIARMNYFILQTITGEFFISFDKVEINRYVKYEIDGKVETIFIDQESLNIPIVSCSLGKTVNETFSIDSKLSRKLVFVKIILIMDKYLALWDDIISEANSPFSKLPIESIKFDSLDKEGIEKTFIENFGASQMERRKHSEKNLDDYYCYNVSFTELSLFNFGGVYIDAYYYLTSTEGNGFYIPPSNNINKSLNFDHQKLVIDFSSGLLFYEFSQKYGFIFEEFIIAESLITLVDNLIIQTDSERSSKISIQIMEDRIVPYFYGENFHDNRIKFLKDIKLWFLTNAKAIVPNEKIDILRPLYEDGKISPSLEFFIDTTFLAQRDGYLLISDDLGYNKLLHLGNKFSNTEFYLLNKFPGKKHLIFQYYLNKKYVGISINKDMLFSAYIERHKSESKHAYNYALRNISSKVNFNPINIFEVVDFLKEIVLNVAISHELYRLDATNILALLISSFPNSSFYFTLRKSIDQKFLLLGKYHDLTIDSSLDALRILNKSRQIIN